MIVSKSPIGKSDSTLSLFIAMRWKDVGRRDKIRLDELYEVQYSAFTRLNQCKDMGQIPKLKIACMGRKPTL